MESGAYKKPPFRIYKPNLEEIVKGLGRVSPNKSLREGWTMSLPCI